MVSGYADAQLSVLGSLLLEPERLAGEIMQQLRPQDFGQADLRHLFEAAREIWLDRSPLDPVTLLAKAGTAYEARIREAMAVTPTAVNWESYVRIVRDGAALARLQSVAAQILDAENADAARALLSSATDALIERPGMKVTSYMDMMRNLLDRVGNSEPPDFLDWGIPALNEVLSISAGRFVILAADSSVGKTALALQLAAGIAAKGKRVGFFSLETSEADAADRMAANRADVALPAIKHKRLREAEVVQLVDAATRDAQLPLDLIEAAGATTDDIRALTLQRRYDVILIDYVQLIPEKGEERWQQVGKVSMALHTMSQQLGVTVIGLSQVTPPPPNKSGWRPALTREHLRESRQLLNDAEAILIMDLVDPLDRNSNRILKIDKNKDGPCGRIVLKFDPTHMRFTYVPPVTDPEDEAAKARNEVMDRNRAERLAKEAARNKTGIDGQQVFEELDESSALPF